MAMNQKQREYALSRVSAIAEARIAAVREKHKLPAIVISPTERADLIRNRKVKLRDGVVEIQTHTDVVHAFDFSKFERKAGAPDSVVRPLIAAINANLAKVKDLIMLGDAEEAVSLIATFESGEADA